MSDVRANSTANKNPADCDQCASPRHWRARPNFPAAWLGLSSAFGGGTDRMAWMIGRTAALSDPAGARAKALAKLRAIAELDDPESLVVPILIDAILMVESYRGARHQVDFLNDLTAKVDSLIRELEIAEKAREWARP
jgi:hypothetical protein